jgi:hypothetical protein
MRQFVALFLSVGALTVFGQTPVDPPETTANKRIELAKQELQKITELVQAGALPRLRLDQAQREVDDAQDDAILERTLYGDLTVENFSYQLTDEMIAAAQRRVERQQARLDQARRLVADGIAPQASLTPLEEEMAIRRMNLSLAHSRANLVSAMAALNKYEKTAAEIHDVTGIIFRDQFAQGMEHYEGSGQFRQSQDLKPLVLAFERKFDHPLPISAEGATNLHRSWGLDHRGRIDVAINPHQPEGIWLLNYLRSRKIPFYAFTRAIRGKATAAHIHIGPGSTRLHNNAD